jgi:hypothetical protein
LVGYASIRAAPDYRVALRGSGCVCLFTTCSPFWLRLAAFRTPALNPAREFVLPFQLHNGVLLGDLRVDVAGDFTGFDAAAADFLPPYDVGTAEGMGLRNRGSRSLRRPLPSLRDRYLCCQWSLTSRRSQSTYSLLFARRGFRRVATGDISPPLEVPKR